MRPSRPPESCTFVPFCSLCHLDQFSCPRSHSRFHPPHWPVRGLLHSDSRKIETASGSVACPVSLTDFDQSLTHFSFSFPCSNFPGLSPPRGLHQILPALFTIWILECASRCLRMRCASQSSFCSRSAPQPWICSSAYRSARGLASPPLSCRSNPPGTIPLRRITCHRVVLQRRSPHSLESSLPLLFTRIVCTPSHLDANFSQR